MPNAQAQEKGRKNKAAGKQFEKRLNEAFALCDMKGLAVIRKTPEPLNVARNLGNGKFLAYYAEKAQPDYQGVTCDGVSIMLEAKFTATEKVDQSRVSPAQVRMLEKYHNMGARCYIVVGYGTGGVYRVPWRVWRDMKDIYGRKYVRESDVDKYRIMENKDHVLMILD